MVMSLLLALVLDQDRVLLLLLLVLLLESLLQYRPNYCSVLFCMGTQPCS